MATESPIRMLETGQPKNWLTSVDPVIFSPVFSPTTGQEEQTRMALNRSGSAPPTVEGSISALRTFIDQKSSNLKNSRSEFSEFDSEEQLRTDPAYMAYYYANVNLNPRLPPPLISHENRHLVRRLRGVGVKKISVAEGLLATHREEPEEDMTSQQTFNGNEQSSVSGMDVASTSGHNRSAIDLVKGDFPEASLHESTKSVEGEPHHVIQTLSTTDQISNRLDQSSGSVNVHVHDVTGFTTTSPCPTNADAKDDGSTQSNIGLNISVIESRMNTSDIPAGLTTNENQRRLENLHLHDQNTRFQAMGPQTHVILQGIYPLNYGIEKLATIHTKLPTMQPFVHNPGLIPPQFATTVAYMNNSANQGHPGFPTPGFPSLQFSPGGYIQNNAYPTQMSFLKPPMETLIGQIDHYRSQMIYPTKPYVQNAFVLRPFTGPFQGRYFQPTIQEAQLVPQFLPHFPAVHESSIPGINHPGMGNDLTVLQLSSENPAASSAWKGQRGSDNSDDCRKNSFLELLKSSSFKKLELSNISGQIVEFSTDQHGSRFIQQKLEHCSNDEKDSVFKEVIPHALKLMTDVFGNYVIQKFFEHGTVEHRRQLGEKLSRQVLSLSLQMYGCRVIQKALEVIELDEKVKLVQELDGHVMRCVHDQNGNHVIQKCIESVPAEKNGFIISSFHSKVAELSSHPYGCRVIQRVLEHCSAEQISRCIINEILDSACALAQDPYGNYVTQHILEMGKPQERTQIIQKLTGKFKQMSQLKYASNVVEKCLKHGDAAERDLIIEEFIGEPNNNDDLLVLMKDQFANYVVQKIFDLGSEKQKEAFLDCIKSNLTVLKRFTYAKQIVARYELLTDAEGSVQDQA